MYDGAWRYNGCCYERTENEHVYGKHPDLDWHSQVGRIKNAVWAERKDLEGFAGDVLDEGLVFKSNGHGNSVVFDRWPQFKFIGLFSDGQRNWRIYPVEKMTSNIAFSHKVPDFHFPARFNQGESISPGPGRILHRPTAETMHRFLELVAHGATERSR